MLARIAVTAAPEQELKFQLGPDAISSLAAVFPPQSGDIKQLHATYFDTPTHALRDAGFSLRVRRDGEVFPFAHRGVAGCLARSQHVDRRPAKIASPSIPSFQNEGFQSSIPDVAQMSRPDAATPRKDQQQKSSTEPAPTVTSSKPKVTAIKRPL